MGLFKTKEEKKLDEIIQSLEMNMSNNYKDNAQDNLKELSAAFEEMKNEGRLKGKTADKYSAMIEDYKVKMKGYTHKDQKPYWV
ncbi:MAG: hypothetical protein K5662_09135 [Lachnospiraceae bacterium]|nr:hypothetical protein [Lachnospiraceae bacterium]